ncbi:hypothetical protein Hypma_011888 [Hypsizygus marmoreus]|uniref:F-box domain-containing protein n=1 Tax=Hypsizygus marmoreus TaxID=39966 RepID=A0A369JIM3_HYPMA|nr:hypothetical protein Hypma_011888 [Hypsizygus marmoreus]
MSSLRSSARLRAKQGATAIPITTPSAAATQPPTKRQKKNTSTPTPGRKNEQSTSKKVRGARGTLRLMTEMPLDILFETFSHLQPGDVLSLSQASKSLREILLNPSSITIWKSAFLNAEGQLPPIPLDLNIVQFTNLLYGRHCHKCGASNATHVHWAARLRLCGSCVLDSVIRPQNQGDRNCLITSLLPLWIVQRPGDKWQGLFYLKADFEHMRKKLLELESNQLQFDEFVQKKTKERKERSEHARLCEYWLVGQRRQRRKQLDRLRRERKAAIIERLKEEGWGEELEIIGSTGIARIPSIEKPQHLTDRIWSNIQGEVIAYLQELKTIRLNTEREGLLWRRTTLLSSIFNAYIASQSQNSVLPSYSDIAGIEPFRSLIYKTSIDTELTKADFEALSDQIPQACANWLQLTTQMLLERLPKRYNLNSSVLDLATVFFRCQWCQEPIAYPRVLKHNCLTIHHQECEDDDDEEFYSAHRTNKPWKFAGKHITFDEEASKIAKDVIAACGHDPKSISASAMDVFDHRVECLRCDHPSRGRLVMRWQTALFHDIKEHYEETWKGARWKLASEDDVAKAKIKEAKSMMASRAYYIGCSHCGLHLTHSQAVAHLRRHSISEEDVEANIFIPLDASINRPPYAVRLPVRRPS